MGQWAFLTGKSSSEGAVAQWAFPNVGHNEYIMAGWVVNPVVVAVCLMIVSFFCEFTCLYPVLWPQIIFCNAFNYCSLT